MLGVGAAVGPHDAAPAAAQVVEVSTAERKLLVPRTRSTWGARRATSPFTRCAMQPSTPMRGAGRACLSGRYVPSRLQTLSSACSRTEQVFTRIRSADAAASVRRQPLRARSPSTGSASSSFIWQPKLTKWTALRRLGDGARGLRSVHRGGRSRAHEATAFFACVTAARRRLARAAGPRASCAAVGVFRDAPRARRPAPRPPPRAGTRRRGRTARLDPALDGAALRIEAHVEPEEAVLLPDAADEPVSEEVGAAHDDAVMRPAGEELLQAAQRVREEASDAAQAVG